MVKLFTHNLLCSNVKGVKNPYPLRIRADEVEYLDDEYDEALTVRMIPRLDYKVRRLASLVGARARR